MLDDTANTRLLESAWQCVHAKDSTVYYVKHHLGNADYHLLVTDLKRIWYDCATADELHEKSRKHRLVIETQEQLSELVAHLGSFLQSLEKCEIRQLNSTHLQIECAELQGFARLTWTFMCKVLDGFQGATVLYDHFILPMLMVADVNQPDVQPSVPLGKPSYCLNQAWLDGLEQATKALAQSRMEASSSPTPPSPPPPAAADHVQEQVVQPSQERETQIVRQQAARKKRRLFG